MVSKRLSSIIITTSLYFVIQSVSHAGVYKWIDEDGQVHYGEQPGNSGAEKITIRTNETTTPRTINKDKLEIIESDKKKAEQPAAEPVEEEISSKEKRKLCNEAKSDIAAINSRGRLREIDEKGNYTYLTEQQRQQRISAAQKKQREFCR